MRHAFEALNDSQKQQDEVRIEIVSALMTPVLRFLTKGGVTSEENVAHTIKQRFS